MYEHGKGVPLDYNQAVYWYRKAAEQGNKDAQSCAKQTKPITPSSRAKDITELVKYFL